MQRDALVKIEMGPNISSSTKASIEKYIVECETVDDVQ